MSIQEKLLTLTKYKNWANEITFSSVNSLPEGEATKKRTTRFGNMVHTLNHVYVIDDVFKCHLLSKPHGYQSRNTENCPSLLELWEKQKDIDLWYINYVETLSESRFCEMVNFEFIGGGHGSMSRADIILHVVNHGTYHRGFVGDMMYQASATPPANDYPVYLREIQNAVIN